ncbi:peroxiredoxin-like family protein [Winogradskyella haliclonae]|uniref:thioredoxin-dependent peroxiredoxin n=1 Tax=Winogradskyella haliclonae TaxID=2048558 RepID=A0ABQ2BZ12_9FLAO|nr:peroxiredoxin-like family protein [Winogradskyella haliclonae]GGI57464.1 peroxiredoxin [Winogradskyella haliclonae]
MNLTEQLQELADNSVKRHPGEAQIIMKSAIEDLIASSILENASKTGDKIPNATLPNAKGESIALFDLLDNSRVVLTFYRGGWCPYCNLELRAYQNKLEAIKSKGTELIAISPETPDNSLSTSEKNNLSFEVLSDINNEFAKQLGLVFQLPESLQELYKKFGISLDENQENSHQELPIAATYIIEQDGTISYHFLEEDYKLRANPDEIIDKL